MLLFVAAAQKGNIIIAVLSARSIKNFIPGMFTDYRTPVGTCLCTAQVYHEAAHGRLCRK